MEEWKEYRLGDIIAIKSGFAYKGDMIGYGENILLGMGCVSFKERFLLSGARAYAGDCADRYCANSGDIVLATRQQSDNLPILGMPAIIPNELSEKRIIIGANLYRVDNESDFSNEYIYWLLKTPLYVNHIRSCQSGTTVRMITKANIEDFRFKAPGRKERDRISSFLKTLDDKIELNRQINDNFVIEPFFEILLIWAITTLINDNLEQQGQALFEEYVMNLNKPRTQLLSDYALINPTRTIAKGRAARCIEMSSLPTKGTFPSDWTFKEYNGGMKFRNGDTIMARITPCLENGKTAYINFLDENEVAFGSTEYIVLSAHEGFCSELLYFLARYDDFVSYAVSHMNGSSGRQRVSGNDIANYVMPEISNETMDVVSEKLHGIMEVIKNNSLESRRLAEIRDALLPRLMSGDFKLEEVNM